MNKSYFFYSVLCLICVMLFNKCSAKKPNDSYEKVLILKITQVIDSYSIHSPSNVYLLMKLSDIEKLTSKHDTLKNSALSYKITANGGLYISKAFTDLYTLGCCEYKNIEKAIKKYKNNKIDDEDLQKYSAINEIKLKNIDSLNGQKLKYKVKNYFYKISYCLAELNYCVCDLYMENPQQKLYSNKAAYIRNIDRIYIPNDSLNKKIKSLFNK